MSLTLVLSVGSDAELLDSRNVVLQTAGYTVVAAWSVPAAIRLFQDGDFDLVLLDRSLSKEDRDRISSFVRATGARIPIVSISSDADAKRESISADTTVSDQPDAILAGIQEALSIYTCPASKSDSPGEKMRIKREERPYIPLLKVS